MEVAAYRVGHTLDIGLRLGVGERLVSGRLLETVGVGNLALARRRGGVPEKTEDRILDVVRVVEQEARANGGEDGLMRVL
jgi:hypothetical protein